MYPSVIPPYNSPQPILLVVRTQSRVRCQKPSVLYDHHSGTRRKIFAMAKMLKVLLKDVTLLKGWHRFHWASKYRWILLPKITRFPVLIYTAKYAIDKRTLRCYAFSQKNFHERENHTDCLKMHHASSTLIRARPDCWRLRNWFYFSARGSGLLIIC